MGSLVPVAQPYHPLMISQQAVSNIRYKISILAALRTHGCDSKYAILRKCHINSTNARIAIRDLIEHGLVNDVTQPRHNGDQNIIGITVAGKLALESWYKFANAICGEIDV